MLDKDILQRFIFDGTDIRGEIVHVNESYNRALERVEYPQEIKKILGQAIAGAALLSATIKFKGRLSLQLQGGDSLSLLLVQVTHEQKLRATARWSGDTAGKEFRDIVKNGRMVITIEPEKGKRYQGIVPLQGDKLGDFLEHYFQQSEQLPTRIWLSADSDNAAGLFLQKLPESDHTGSDDNWTHVTTLASTITDHELLELANTEVLYRLYHEEKVRLFDPHPVEFDCNCSKETCEKAVLSLGPAEIGKIMEDQEGIDMNCDFCNAAYTIDIVDLTRLHKMAEELARKNS